MYLRSLYLRCFRKYEEAFFEFSPYFNIFFGANAQGKTTILEAIHCLMVGRSFRTQQNKELIKESHDHFFIEASFSKYDVEQTIKFSFDGHERKMTYNQTPLPSTSTLLGIIPGVIMTPDDVGLVKGAPVLRRQFLDMQLAQIDPLYVHHLTRYNKAIRHRNQLLKAKHLQTMDSWEIEMSHSAAYITLKRYEAIIHLQPRCQTHYHVLTEEAERLNLNYKTDLPQEISLANLQHYLLGQLRKNRMREMAFGHTLVGPHKDDLSLFIDGKEVKHYASEGQQRSTITAVRFAEWEHLNQVGNDTPLFLIDDAGLSLDHKRQSQLVQMLEKLGQVFMTTTNQSLVDTIQSNKKVFHIQKGKIVHE